MHASARLPATAELDRAIDALKAGQVIGLPTETVYGLGADAASETGVARIYAVKGRPAGHPLIVHVVDADAAKLWARWDARADRLASAFWPGPLTMILPRLPDAPAWACGDQSTIGLRAPSHPVAQALLARGLARGVHGIAAPSANRFGRVSPTTAAHVREDLGDEVDVVLDGGSAEVGIESTIVDLSRARAALLRPGRIHPAQIESALGEVLRLPEDAPDDLDARADAPRVSGSMKSHYAPRAAVVLAAQDSVDATAAGLASRGPVAIWSRTRPAGLEGHWWPFPPDPSEAEQHLYATLRAIDASGVAAIVIEKPPALEGWRTVSDRLTRAAG